MSDEKEYPGEDAVANELAYAGLYIASHIGTVVPALAPVSGITIAIMGFHGDKTTKFREKLLSKLEEINNTLVEIKRELSGGFEELSKGLEKIDNTLNKIYERLGTQLDFDFIKQITTIDTVFDLISALDPSNEDNKIRLQEIADENILSGRDDSVLYAMNFINTALTHSAFNKEILLQGQISIGGYLWLRARLVKGLQLLIYGCAWSKADYDPGSFLKKWTQCFADHLQIMFDYGESNYTINGQGFKREVIDAYNLKFATHYSGMRPSYEWEEGYSKERSADNDEIFGIRCTDALCFSPQLNPNVENMLLATYSSGEPAYDHRPSYPKDYPYFCLWDLSPFVLETRYKSSPFLGGVSIHFGWDIPRYYDYDKPEIIIGPDDPRKDELEKWARNWNLIRRPGHPYHPGEGEAEGHGIGNDEIGGYLSLYNKVAVRNEIGQVSLSERFSILTRLAEYKAGHIDFQSKEIFELCTDPESHSTISYDLARFIFIAPCFQGDNTVRRHPNTFIHYGTCYLGSVDGMLNIIDLRVPNVMFLYDQANRKKLLTYDLEDETNPSITGEDLNGLSTLTNSAFLVQGTYMNWLNIKTRDKKFHLSIDENGSWVLIPDKELEKGKEGVDLGVFWEVKPQLLKNPFKMEPVSITLSVAGGTRKQKRLVLFHQAPFMHLQNH